ncbi:MAG: glycosyltransferase family 2 protein [Oceanospirillaceae bacterium]|nr:glycosyltransferase family 2 protein [Oceanospirillaceae bacterium]
MISIAIPTWNRSALLKRTLWSLVEAVRKYRDAGGTVALEVYVSDNASVDRTFEVVTLFTDIFYSLNVDFQYVRNAENIGYDKNYLQCLTHSRGDYVFVIGDDDVLSVDSIISLVKICRLNPDFIILSSQFKSLEVYNRSRYHEYLVEDGVVAIGQICSAVYNKSYLGDTELPVPKVSSWVQVDIVFRNLLQCTHVLVHPPLVISNGDGAFLKPSSAIEVCWIRRFELLNVFRGQAVVDKLLKRNKPLILLSLFKLCIYNRLVEDEVPDYLLSKDRLSFVSPFFFRFLYAISLIPLWLIKPIYGAVVRGFGLEDYRKYYAKQVRKSENVRDALEPGNF